MTQPSTETDMNKPIRLGLERITKLLTALGNPHLKVPIIHVAGTNGKGSVCAYLDSILRTAGYEVGRFTSPHLVEVRDCITLNGSIIPQAAFQAAQAKVIHADETAKITASSFEKLTATAFQAFSVSQPDIDVAVVEVGMGGLTDATNVCPAPLATVITAIDLDHQAFLGNTFREIATVKAGIIKRNTACVVSPQADPEALQAIQAVAASLDAPLHTVTVPNNTVVNADAANTISLAGKPISVKLPLAGAYQIANASTAATTIDVLRSTHAAFRSITDKHIVMGIEATRWPGRLDWISYKGHSILVDGAHNGASIAALKQYLQTLPQAETTLVVALSAPRDPNCLLEPLLTLPNIRKVYCSGFSTPEGMPWVEALDPETIATAVRDLGRQVNVANTIQASLDDAIASNQDGTIVVCGSLYLVADLYRLLEDS